MTCTEHKDCEEECRGKYGAKSGICSYDKCECQLDDNKWQKLWELANLERIKGKYFKILPLLPLHEGFSTNAFKNSCRSLFQKII